MTSSLPIFISFVYGSPNQQVRKDLWKDLRSSIPSGKISWLVIGDFNAILLTSEKSIGLTQGRKCPFLGDFVDSANLHNLGFSRPLSLGMEALYLRD